MRRTALVALGFLGLLTTAGLFGCAAPNEAFAHPTPPANNDQLVQQIKNTPGMPEDQKQAAIARLTSNRPAPKLYAH